MSLIEKGVVYSAIDRGSVYRGSMLYCTLILLSKFSIQALFFMALFLMFYLSRLYNISIVGIYLHIVSLATCFDFLLFLYNIG